MITYPTTLDSLPNPTSTDLMENATLALGHDQQHSNANDAIEALEAKVGINSSAVTTSHDYKLSGVTGSDKAVSKTGTETLTNKTITSPQINFGSDANGDMIYRNASGVTTRLPAGSALQVLNIDSGTGLPAWVSNPAASTADYSTAGVATIDSGVRFYAVDTSGSSTVYVATMSPVPNAYVTGQSFKVKFVNANTTTTPTINLNGLGAKTIVKGVSTALAVGDISANMIGDIQYDGTNFVLKNPATVGLNSYAVVSDTLQTSADTEQSTTSGSYAKLKEILVLFPGTYRIKFDAKSAIASTSYGRIYKNGTAYGTEQTVTSINTYNTYSQDLQVYAGDLIQLYAYAVGGATTVSVRNFRLYYTKTTYTVEEPEVSTA